MIYDLGLYLMLICIFDVTIFAVVVALFLINFFGDN
jgi:hypothetical protein